MWVVELNIGPWHIRRRAQKRRHLWAPDLRSFVSTQASPRVWRAA